MHETGPFSIPAIRDFVPPKLRPWIIIVFVIIFQFSGGIYLSAVSEMVGSTALMQEDIMMAGYGGHGADVRHHVPPEIPLRLEDFADDVQHSPDYCQSDMHAYPQYSPAGDNLLFCRHLPHVGHV